LNKDRISEREALARDNKLPKEVLMEVSRTYAQIAEKITGEKILLSENPKDEIIDILDRDYGLIV
jgi:phosphoribosylaminoimidazole-succinocarboxamide synthase